VWIRPREQKVVGHGLADARKRQGVTQSELAKQLRKPPSFVSAYENGQRRDDSLEFIRIANALEVNPRKVFAAIIRQQRIL
jgi:transcriptional regulator with XRE-family HTH domain